MNKNEYEEKIKAQITIDAECLPSFQTSIDILAEILEERDRVHEAYIKDGARPVIDFTSDRGSVNPKKNPLLMQWQDLNAQALAYLRDLGITPAGMRKLQGTIPTQTQGGKLEKMLEDIMNTGEEIQEE